MADALAEAFAAPKDAVRRAAMLSGRLAGVAEALASDGASALDRFFSNQCTMATVIVRKPPRLDPMAINRKLKTKLVVTTNERGSKR